MKCVQSVHPVAAVRWAAATDVSAGIASCMCKQLQAVGISVQSLAKAGSRGMASLCSCLETLFRELVKEVPQPLPQKWVLPPWE